MKRILLSSLFFLGGIAMTLGQCPIGSQYQSGTAPTPGNSVTMTTCAYAGEYQQIDVVVSGNDYTITYTGGVSNYVTIYDAGLIPVAWGVSPLVWTATASGTYYSQPNLNDGLCGTDLSCHTGVWTNTSPPPPCPAEIAPWTETFTTTVDPPCWTQSATTGGPWVYTGSPGYDVSGTLDHTSGVTNNYVWIDFSSTDVGVILTTPEIDVTALTIPELKFWEISHYTGVVTPYNLIYVEAWDGLSWNVIGTYQGETGSSWVEHSIIITPANIYNTNFVQVRFRAESGGSSDDFYNDLLIDDVSIDEAPTCPQPIALVLDSADLTSGSISWTPTGSETEWAIEYGAPGFTPGTGTTVLTSPNPWYTITGLTAQSFYDVYVRAACTPGDTSFYTGALALNTYNQGAYMDYDNSCGPGFNDISATGVENLLGDDGEVGWTLPFDLLYQGTLVNELTIGSNGGILFNTLTGQLTFSNGTMSGALDGLYPFWDDLGPEDPGEGVYYEVIGTAPNRQAIIQWNKDHLSGNGNTYIFQVVIDEATQDIYFIYDVIEVMSTPYDFGGSATVGIAGSNQDVQVSMNNTVYLEGNTCAHFYYTDCPNPTNFAVTYTTVDEGAITWGSGLAGETNWTVIYGEAGFDPTMTGTTVSTSASTLVMPGLNDITCYDVYIYAECGPGLTSNGYMGTFCTLPNCANPTGLGTATAVDTVMSNWSFIENVGFPSTGFGIQYGWTGFTPGNGTIAYVDNNLTDTTADVTLMGGGVYQMYVQAVCGTDSSEWVGPVSFTMPLTNDSTCFAAELAVDGTVYTFNNVGATTDAGEATIAPPGTGCDTQDGWCNSNVTFSTWFTFVAPASGNVRIDGDAVAFNGQLAVYDVTDCNDFATYTLVGANDNSGVFGAPMVEICGLTAGNTYFLMHDSFSTFITGVYSIELNAIVVEAGTDNGLSDICLGDTIDLFTNITGNDAGGVWYENMPTANFNDPYFVSAGLASQVFGFDYVVVDGCAVDSISTSVQIYGPSTAGTDGTITTCKNQPINLLNGLSGLADLGGVWYDSSLNSTPSAISASSTSGTYSYNYIVGNGVCPDDTANVVVNVDNNCDYLNIQEMYFGDMDIHPNPTTGMVYISNAGSNEVFNIELIDIKGKVITTQAGLVNGTEISKVDLGNLETGMYMIHVYNKTAEKTFRIIKE